MIELLAVIIILSLLAMLASIAITKIVKDSKSELSNTQMELIKSSAQIWGADNQNKLPSVGTCGYLTLEDLKDYGIIDSNVIDPETSLAVSNDLNIKITTQSNSSGLPKIIYEVDPESVEGCSHINIINGAGLYKPQYYTGSSFSGTIGSTNAPVESQRSTTRPTGKSAYLGYDVNNGKVSAAYACFVRNNKEYCLKGSDLSNYKINKGIIADAFEDVIDTSDCYFDNSETTCDIGLLVHVESDGFVYASDGSWECSVDESGNFS